MLTNIVVEGKQDAAILDTLFNDLLRKKRLKIYIACRKDAAHSLALTLLAKNGRPLILAVNANTRDEPNIKQEKAGLEFLVNLAAAGQETKVVIMAPAIEKIFFDDPRKL